MKKSELRQIIREVIQEEMLVKNKKTGNLYQVKKFNPSTQTKLSKTGSQSNISSSSKNGPDYGKIGVIN